MPNYTFENKETGEIIEKTMKISERDEFVENNPHLQQIITGAPAMVSSVSGVSTSIKQSDGMKEVFQKAAEAHPNSPLAERYGKKSIKDIKTRDAVNKHRGSFLKRTND